MLIKANIIFFYSEVMPYTIACLDAISEKIDGNINVVYWDKNKFTPFLPNNFEKIEFHSRSKFINKKSFKSFIEKNDPSLIYVSGWMDKGYLVAAKYARSKKIKVVCGIDNQFYGSLRQWFARLFSWYLLKPYFSYIWVPGRLQYEYARFLGFSKDKIVFNLYSGDVKIFSEAFLQRKEINHKILFVGRFHMIKGIDILWKAFIELKNDIPNDWKLHFIGNGSLKDCIPKHPDIIVSDFMSSDNMATVAKDAAIFCLPSRKESWGVVIHEFAAAGLPLLTSSCCGANSEFLINGFNGLIFERNNQKDLKDKLKILISLTDKELLNMGESSHGISKRISPESSSANLLSILQ
jgi:glycosyltransferase involved in cell wall biosynthesis